jgi:hypothetical protein
MTDMAIKSLKQIKPEIINGTELQAAKRSLQELTGTPYLGMKMTKTILKQSTADGYW